MRTKLSLRVHFTIYFFLLMILYHYKVKTYFYWRNIAFFQDTYFDFSFGRFLIATCFFFINLYVIVKPNNQRLGFIVLSLVFALSTIPSLISFTSENMYPWNLLVYHQILFWGIFFASKVKIDLSKIPTLNKRQALYLFLIITTIGIIPYLLAYGPYINLRNLILQDVYETRSAVSHFFSNPYFGYSYSVFTKIIIPLLIVFALELRNRFLVAVGIIYLILFYLFGAHKTVYLGLIAILIFYRWSYMQSIRKVLKYSSLLIVVCIVLALFSYDYPWILTFRRIHFLPALLDIVYLDFFKDQPLYWSESILKGFVEYPYDVEHKSLIGQVYFGSDTTSANNGLISDGIMNFGSIGVLINIFLVSVYFMILNNLKIPSKYFGIYLLVVFSFLSSATFTVFLTHGAIALLLISIFLLNDRKEKLE